MKIFVISNSQDVSISIERQSDRTKYFLIQNGEKMGHLTVQENLDKNNYWITMFRIYDKKNWRQGWGRKLMNSFLNDEKYMDKPVSVIPYPYNEKEMSAEELEYLYRHFGFKYNNSRAFSLEKRK